jgi:hypothetical protein
MEGKYLPIGTVVLLKGGSKRIMICGFCCHGTGENDKLFDYVGCLSPEGFISSDKNLLFNHDQIEKIISMGFVDEEEKQFKEKLNNVLKLVNRD